MWEPTRGTTLNKHLLTTAAKLASWQIAKNYAGNHMFYVLAHSASKPWKFKTSKWTTKKTTLTLEGLKTRATTAGTRMISITSMSFWGEGRWTYSPHLSEPSPDGYKLWSHLQVQWLGLRSALHLEQLKTTPLALPAEPTALLVSRAAPWLHLLKEGGHTQDSVRRLINSYLSCFPLSHRGTWLPRPPFPRQENRRQRTSVITCLQAALHGSLSQEAERMMCAKHFGFKVESSSTCAGESSIVSL